MDPTQTVFPSRARRRREETVVSGERQRRRPCLPLCAPVLVAVDAGDARRREEGRGDQLGGTEAKALDQVLRFVRSRRRRSSAPAADRSRSPNATRPCLPSRPSPPATPGERARRGILGRSPLPPGRDTDDTRLSISRARCPHPPVNRLLAEEPGEGRRRGLGEPSAGSLKKQTSKRVNERADKKKSTTP